MKIQFENGQVVEFSGEPTPADIEEVAKSLKVEPAKGLVPDNLDRRDTSIMENLFDVPAAAMRSMIQGTGYQYGAQNFRHVPKFQDLAIQAVNDNINKFDPQAGTTKRFILGLPASAAGLAADIATNPADVLAMVAGKTPMGGGKNLGDVISSFPASKAAGKVLNYPLDKIPSDIKRGVMSVVTKDPELAAEFVANPKKFNIDPFEKAPSFEREREASTNYMKNVREDFKRKTEDFRIDTATKIQDMQTEFQNTRQAMLSAQPQEVQAASQRIDASLASVEDSIKNRLLSSYDDTIRIVDRMHEDIGASVGDALKGILQKNPEATLPRRAVFDPAYEAIQEASRTAKMPFDLTVNADGSLIVTGKTGLTDPKDVQIFSNLWKDLNPEGGFGEYKISKLQVLKEQLQTLAKNYMDEGKGNLSHLYSKLSQIVNPANAISKNPELSKLLPELSKANKSYADFKPAYEEMLGLYTKPDANGNPVPDFRKVWKAVEDNDVSTLRRIREAEARLPETDRILPKVETAVKDSKLAKDIAVQEFKKTNEQFKLQLQDLDNKQAEALRTARGEERQARLKLVREARETIRIEQQKIQKHLNFIQDQENLRAWPSMIAGNVIKGVDAVAAPFRGPANGLKNVVEGLSSIVRKPKP